MLILIKPTFWSTFWSNVPAECLSLVLGHPCNYFPMPTLSAVMPDNCVHAPWTLHCTPTFNGL